MGSDSRLQCATTAEPADGDEMARAIHADDSTRVNRVVCSAHDVATVHWNIPQSEGEVHVSGIGDVNLLRCANVLPLRAKLGSRVFRGSRVEGFRTAKPRPGGRVRNKTGSILAAAGQSKKCLLMHS